MSAAIKGNLCFLQLNSALSPVTNLHTPVTKKLPKLRKQVHIIITI